MPANDIDPGLLRTLVAIHDTGGFSAAARELNLTQSAVSHQVKRLEERVGRPLLNRTTRQVSFNEDGREFLHRATRLLDAMDSLHRHLSPSAITGVVRFGIPDAVLGDRLPSLFAQFSRLFPCIRLEVSAGMSLDLRRSVGAGELDLAVVMDAEPIEPNRVLRREPLVWVAGDTFRMQQPQPLPLALHPPPCVNRNAILTALGSRHIDSIVTFTCPSTRGIQAAVLAGFAISALCESQMTSGMRAIGDEFGLPPLPMFTLGLIQKVPGSAPVQEFEQLITRALRNESPIATMGLL